MIKLKLIPENLCTSPEIIKFLNGSLCVIFKRPAIVGLSKFGRQRLKWIASKRIATTTAIVLEINSFAVYRKKLTYLSGNNKLYDQIFNCKVNRKYESELIEVWDVTFRVNRFDEICSTNNLEVKNTYYVENSGIVRRSRQFHSKSIGFMIIERLQRPTQIVC